MPLKRDVGSPCSETPQHIAPEIALLPFGRWRERCWIERLASWKLRPQPDREIGRPSVINMRERVLQLRGTFEFDSVPGRGTTVKAEVPFRPAS